MKLLTNISRILVGSLFIFSGVIKSNDPKGTGIKFNEYFDVFASSVQSPQDTLRLKVTDNFGSEELFENTFNSRDSFVNIEVNQSAPRMELFEGDVDSSYGSEIFVIKNGTVLFNMFYPLEKGVVLDSAADLPEVSIDMSSTLAFRTDKKGLNKHWSFILTDQSKHEFSEQVAVYDMVNQDVFWVGFFRGLKPYALSLSIFMCVLEVVLGFALLIGWQSKWTSYSLLGVIVFFTFLTWYSAYFNKVTDCGCFGDFIKLKPWHSFYKDLVLLFFIIIIVVKHKQIVPLFSPLFSINAMIVATLSSTVFTIYCNMFLPAWDFLPYKMGNNVKQLMEVPKGERIKDSTVMVFVYKKNNQVDSFVYPNMPDSSWTYVDRVDKVIIPAWKSKIHDFEFIQRPDNDVQLKDSLLNGKRYAVLIVVTHLEKSHAGAWEAIQAMSKEALKSGIAVYAVTASPIEMADAFVNEHQLPFKFNNADETLLKTMVRSNPGVMFWHNGVIIDKWSCRSVPSIQKLKHLMGRP